MPEDVRRTSFEFDSNSNALSWRGEGGSESGGWGGADFGGQGSGIWGWDLRLANFGGWRTCQNLSHTMY